LIFDKKANRYLVEVNGELPEALLRALGGKTPPVDLVLVVGLKHEITESKVLVSSRLRFDKS
jgi:hypothetical protein